MSYSDFTLIVTAGILLERGAKALLRSLLGDFCEIRTGHISSGGCIGIICLDTHFLISLSCHFAR